MVNGKLRPSVKQGKVKLKSCRVEDKRSGWLTLWDHSFHKLSSNLISATHKNYEWKYHFPSWEIKGEHDEKSINPDTEQIKICIWTFEDDLGLWVTASEWQEEGRDSWEEVNPRGFLVLVCCSGLSSVSSIEKWRAQNDDVWYLFECPLISIKEKIETHQRSHRDADRKGKRMSSIIHIGKRRGKELREELGDMQKIRINA